MLVSATMYEDSKPSRALLEARKFGTLAVSRAAYAEYDDVLHRAKFEHRFSVVNLMHVLDLVVVAATWIEPLEEVTDCRDAKDNCYLALAAAAGAECIVSSDDDLLVLNPWRGIEIIKPAEFLAYDRMVARIESTIDARIAELYGDLADGEDRELIRDRMRAYHRYPTPP